MLLRERVLLLTGCFWCWIVAGATFWLGWKIVSSDVAAPEAFLKWCFNLVAWWFLWSMSWKASIGAIDFWRMCNGKKRP